MYKLNVYLKSGKEISVNLILNEIPKIKKMSYSQC